MLKDNYARPLTSIRISVTQKCNLNCFYCHKEGENHDSRIEMTPEEIERIVEVVASFSIREVKLTGGEPLLRSDILEIVERVSSVPGVKEVSMTTNGTLLSKLAKQLKDAGLKRVNVSLDTLEPDTYKSITDTNAINNVIEGIHEAVNVGLHPVKMNSVLLRGLNDKELWKILEFSKKNGLVLQLIELEEICEDKFYHKYHLDLTETENWLKEKAKKVFVRSMHHRRKYFLPDDLEVEVVKPMHNTEFCKHCSRIRVTSDGKFKPCLFRQDNLVDFLFCVKNQSSNETLRKLFKEAVNRRRPYFT